MRIPKDDIPVKFDVPGAVARQLPDFGDSTGFGTIGGEYFSLAAGTDIAPLLHGLSDHACHSPHWGYVVSGVLVVDYVDGAQDTCAGGDLFHWPPGHSVKVTADAEVILFSPKLEHTEVLDHMLGAMQQA